MILPPEISLAEGLVFVEELYSSIHSLKVLNPNRDHYKVQKPLLLMDNNNNSDDDLDIIENDPDVELPIKCSEDKESRMTEANSIAEDIIDDEDQIQDNEASEFGDEVFSSVQPCVVEKLSSSAPALLCSNL